MTLCSPFFLLSDVGKLDYSHASCFSVVSRNWEMAMNTRMTSCTSLLDIADWTNRNEARVMMLFLLLDLKCWD